MRKYVFISNSAKPSINELNSREPIKASNIHKPAIEIALSMGYEVYLGVNRKNPEGLLNELNVNLYDSHTYRSLIDFKSNYIAYRNLMNLLNKGDFEIIHCNTPIGGVLGRICGKFKGVNTIIYTAHGFHFYNGAPLFNRTIIKWVEMVLAHWTDAIITMNQEDFIAAQKFKLRNKGKVYYVPGVGIKTKDYQNIDIDKSILKKEIGLKDDDIILIAMGDLIKRKNYEASIKAIAHAKDTRLHFIICGKGPELENLKRISLEMGVSDQVHFLGFRSDIKELLHIADVFLFTTYQEGMPRSMMEAMASGLPCIASKIRGNVELIDEDKGGFLYAPEDIKGFSEGIKYIVGNKDLRNKMGMYNIEKIKKFDEKNVKFELQKIYQEIILSK